MADDDCIQFLGMKAAAPRVSLPSPLFLNSQRPVTGVVLELEKSATEVGHGMIFHKSDSPVVHIGRRPGSDSEKRRNEPGKAFFSCPVVSRHHAKLAFSDSGHVYLIDLDSHHGTHIRKRDDAVSKQVAAETPTLLADGDVVTFGKSVGSDKGLVRPVVAKVELLYGPRPSFKPLVVPATSISRSPSGRYGVYLPEASPSSDEASPDSHDSDVEEISGPPQVSIRPPWHESASGSDSMPSLGAQKPISESFPARFSPFGFSDEHRAFSPGPLELPANNDADFYNVGFDAYSNDIFEEDDNDDNSDDSNYSSRSRSTSPMDLSSSPEPALAPAVGLNTVAVGEPTVIGAWPRSRSPSVFSSSFPPVRIVSAPLVEELAAPKPIVDENPEVVEVAGNPNESDEEVIVVDKEETDEVVIVEEKEQTDKPVENTETAQLKASLATIKTEIARLHAHRRKYKQRFNDNIHVMGDKFADLEERTTEAHDLYHLLSDRLEENEDACHQAQTQLDALQVRMDDMAEKGPTVIVETPIVAETSTYAEEAKARAKVLEDMVAEMTTLRDNARKEMADELQTIREAKEALKSLTEQVQVQTESLKRKRPDEEVEVDVAPTLEVAAPPVVAEPMGMPPRKRAKRVAKVVAQTATAISVGVVVTWSALAFS
ncbi:hypothetical protein B0H16DRAFT_1561955 [Mycena metata]|uniref:FHA domain-containing protein n=1 Tax=Mycena metata TaxID=1033252 RepID=A0AAD7IH95_9AGAR|nr:hypothetical protein B0H16DRAFT_1561955 [Mycena metata]